MIKLSDIKEICFGASDIIEKYYHMERNVEYKKDGSPLTIADIKTNEYLHKKLTALFPEAGWLSEESKDNRERLNNEYVWIVDPVDGTKEFVEKVPHISLSVALVHKNKPVLGAVLNPISKEGGIGSIWEECQFWGFEKVNEPEKLEDSTVTVSRSEYKKGQTEPFSGILKNIKPIGSVAYKLMLVAGGREHMYFSVAPKSEWDICGGIALLNLTNKTYKLFNGEENLFNQESTLVSSGAVAGSEDKVNEFLSTFKDEISDYINMI